MSYHQEPMTKRAPKFRITGRILTTGQHGMRNRDATYTAVRPFWITVFDMNYPYYFERSISISLALAIFLKFLGWADALSAGVQTL